MNADLETFEGTLGNILRADLENANEINRADVAELVDARDLKDFAKVNSEIFSMALLPRQARENAKKPAIWKQPSRAHQHDAATPFPAPPGLFTGVYPLEGLPMGRGGSIMTWRGAGRRDEA